MGHVTWRPANNGAGARIWFVCTDAASAAEVQYHWSVRGDLIRYKSHASAARAAERLNRAGAVQ